MPLHIAPLRSLPMAHYNRSSERSLLLAACHGAAGGARAGHQPRGDAPAAHQVGGASFCRRDSTVRDPGADDVGPGPVRRRRWIWIPLAFVQGFTVFNFTILLHEVLHHLVFATRHPVAERVLGLAYAIPERDFRDPVHALASRPSRGAGFERRRPETASSVAEGQRALVQAAVCDAGAVSDLLQGGTTRNGDVSGRSAAHDRHGNAGCPSCSI